MLKHKYLFLLILFAFLLPGCGWDRNINVVVEEDDIVQPENVSKTISVNIQIDNGQELMTDSFSVIKGSSVFDMMKKMEDENKIEMEYQESGVGVFIESINGINNSASENNYWMFYVNDNLSNVGASEYVINDNDIIEWRFDGISDISFD